MGRAVVLKRRLAVLVATAMMRAMMLASAGMAWATPASENAPFAA
jgi:hypothetical protein